MTRLESAMVSVAVSLLPQQERRRYAEELDSDMRSQPRWGRLWYAVSIVLATPRLRWEILTRLAGQPVPYCFVGLHRDRTLHPNSDEPWIIAHECVLCHRVHDPRQYAGRQDIKALGWIISGQGK